MNATTLKRLSMLEQLISPAGDRESTDEEQMACVLETLTDAERAAFDAATGSGSRAKLSPEQQAVIETVEKAVPGVEDTRAVPLQAPRE